MKLDAVCLEQFGLSNVALGGRVRLAVQQLGRKKQKIAQGKSSDALRLQKGALTTR